MSKEERKKCLKKTLKDHFRCEIIDDIKNIDYSLLLILDYSPTDNEKIVSFAFSLLKYYEGSDRDFDSRFWMTEKYTYDNSNSNTKWPNYHEDYKKFQYQNYSFYPFSATIKESNFLDIRIMKALLRRLYGCIKFEVKNE